MSGFFCGLNSLSGRLVEQRNSYFFAKKSGNKEILPIDEITRR